MASRIQIGALVAGDETAFGDEAEAHGPDIIANNYLAAYDTELTLEEEALEDEIQRDYITHVPPVPGSKRGSTLSFKMRMAAEGALQATSGYILAKLLNWAWGNATLLVGEGKKSQVGASGNASTVIVADGGNTFYKIGQAVVVKDITAGGPKEMRWITNRANGGGNTTLTLNQPLSFTPTDVGGADQVYTGHTIYPKDTLDGATSVFFRAYREETNEAWDLFGCRPSSVKIAPDGGFLVVSFEYMVTSWVQRDGVALPGFTWQWGSPMPYLRHRFSIGSPLTGSLHVRPNWEFDLGVALQDIESPQEQGRADWEIGDRRIVGSYSPRWVKAEWTRFTSQTVHELMMNGEDGVRAGLSHWGFHVGASHLTEQPKDDAEGQLRYLNCAWRAGEHSTDVGSTAPADTDARIAIITSD